jgi:hypothetical protein
MKTFQSTIEGAWTKIVPVQLTDVQKELLLSTKDEDKDAKRILSQEISSQMNGIPNSEETAQLNSLYNSVKPELKEDESYQLLSITVLGHEDEELSGILNYRINKEHKQIRF